jgi:hypothetical protein
VPGGDPDQIGWLSVATELDFWVRDWIAARDMREHLPAAAAAELVQWLRNRLEWACLHHPAVDEFAEMIRTLRTALRTVLGETGPHPEPVRNVPCRGCDLLTLVRKPGSAYIECGNCPTLLTEEEFRRWAGLVAEGAKRRMPA